MNETYDNEVNTDEYEIDTDSISDNNLKIYFKDISQYKLLTKEDERALCEDIERKNNALKTLEELKSEQDLLDKDLYKSLDDMIKQGDEARRKLINSNLRLVVSVAKKYLSQTGIISFDELIQEGNIALMQAVDRFDYKKGRFTTFAMSYIEPAIRKAINPNNLSEYALKQLNKLKKTSKILLNELLREPTDEEIADALKWTIDKVIEVKKWDQIIISTDTPVEGTDKQIGTIGENIENQDPPTDEFVQHNIDNNENIKLFSEILKKFDDTERQILYMHFGLKGQNALSVNDIAKKLAWPLKRVEITKNRVLRKLQDEPELYKNFRNLGI